MQIIEIAEDNFHEWLDLTLKLWSDSPVEEMQITLQSILFRENARLVNIRVKAIANAGQART